MTMPISHSYKYYSGCVNFSKAKNQASRHWRQAVCELLIGKTGAYCPQSDWYNKRASHFQVLKALLLHYYNLGMGTDED